MKKHERRSLLHGRCALWIAVGCAALAPLGCGSDNCADAANSCAGAGGASAAGGTGGTGGTAGTGETGGTAGTGTGGTAGTGGSAGDTGADASGATCGGFASLRCPDPELSFCDYDDKEACGIGDLTGICTPRPSACVEGGPGVCGCDGKFYLNACLAHQAGTDDLPNGTCSDAGN